MYFTDYNMLKIQQQRHEDDIRRAAVRRQWLDAISQQAANQPPRDRVRWLGLKSFLTSLGSIWVDARSAADDGVMLSCCPDRRGAQISRPRQLCSNRCGQ